MSWRLEKLVWRQFWETQKIPKLLRLFETTENQTSLRTNGDLLKSAPFIGNYLVGGLDWDSIKKGEPQVKT